MVSDSTISANTAGDGGAGGVATVGSVANGQSGNGGSGNSGGNGGAGGGIVNGIGTATIDASTITANTSGAGGAGTAGQNSAPTQGNGGGGGAGGSGGNGAGIASTGSMLVNASLQATNDTIAGNIAGSGASGGNPGGAASDIFQDGRGGSGGNGGYGGGLVNLLHSTSTAGQPDDRRECRRRGREWRIGLRQFPGGRQRLQRARWRDLRRLVGATLQNTILYENQTGGDCRGTITDGAHNLVFSLPQLGGVVPDPCNLSGSAPDPQAYVAVRQWRPDADDAIGRRAAQRSTRYRRPARAARPQISAA